MRPHPLFTLPLRFVLVALLLCPLLASALTFNLPNAALADEVSEVPEPDNQKVFQTLNQSFELELLETPLSDATKFLEQLTGLKVLLDKPNMNDVGLGSDTPITYNTDGESLDTVLNLILSPLDLAYLAEDGMLLITTKEMAAKTHLVQVYPVADLLVPADLLDTFLAFCPLGADCSHGVSSLPGQRSAKQLQHLLTTVVDYNSWDEVGGPASVNIVGSNLVIRQTQKNHWTIQKLLEVFRELLAAKPAGLERREISTCPRNSKIAPALESATRLEFMETPLNDAVAFIADLHGIPVRIDEKSLNDAGIGSDVSVTLTLTDVPLRVGLKQMLGQLRLTSVVQGDVLLITTEEVAYSMQTLTVHNVAPLITKTNLDGSTETDFSELLNGISATIAPGSWESQGGLGQYATFGSLVVFVQTPRHQAEITKTLDALYVAFKKHPPQQISPDKVEMHIYPVAIFSDDMDAKMEVLIGTITSTVEPKSWASSGGAGTIESVNGSLVIRHTRRAHFAVRQLLEKLSIWSANPSNGIRTQCFPSGGGVF